MDTAQHATIKYFWCMKQKEEHGKRPTITQNGQPFEVPVMGSLGLLALGYQGWVAWQDKLEAVKNEQDGQKAG